MENNKNNAPLWFIGGLLLGGTPIFPFAFGCLGVISVIVVFSIGTVLSALTYAVVTHWYQILLFVIFGSVFALLGYLYILEEKKKRENQG